MTPGIPKFELEWLEPAEEEFFALPKANQKPIARKLLKILDEPARPKQAQPGALAGCNRIKLRAAGIRLIYKIEHDKLIVLDIAVGRRTDNEVYTMAERR